MSEKYRTAVDRVLGHEGGYVNNPRDPGGETNWGISKRSYPLLDIKRLTREQAVEIYYKDFWLPVRGNDLPLSIAYQLFDFAVNSGIKQAIKGYQRAIGANPDGIWGPESQKAADKVSEADTLMLLLAERLDFMTNLSNWPDASKGWSRRIAQNLRYSAEDTSDR